MSNESDAAKARSRRRKNQLEKNNEQQGQAEINYAGRPWRRTGATLRNGGARYSSTFGSNSHSWYSSNDDEDASVESRVSETSPQYPLDFDDSLEGAFVEPHRSAAREHLLSERCHRRPRVDSYETYLLEQLGHGNASASPLPDFARHRVPYGDDEPLMPGEETVSLSDQPLSPISDEREDPVEETEEDKYKNRHVRLEERLEDDLLNTYCEKLHDAVNKEVDGMLAIQYILVEPGQIKTLVTGQKRVCQILYDEHRQHYVVVTRASTDPKVVVVYDSLAPPADYLSLTLNSSICKQLAALFGHLYEDGEMIDVAVETGIYPQTDGWSCGLRAAAHITHVVLGLDPLEYEYEPELIRDFFSDVLDTEKPTRALFTDANFGKMCRKRDSKLLCAKITRSGELMTRDRRKSAEMAEDETLDNQTPSDEVSSELDTDEDAERRPVHHHRGHFVRRAAHKGRIFT